MPRILLIDPGIDTATPVAQTLRTAGYEVVLAADGSQAVAEHCSRPADLVIIDLSLPNGEALETVRNLRACLPELMIIGLCGRAPRPSVVHTAFRLGVLAIIPTSMSFAELLVAVGKALRMEPQLG